MGCKPSKASTDGGGASARHSEQRSAASDEQTQRNVPSSFALQSFSATTTHFHPDVHFTLDDRILASVLSGITGTFPQSSFPVHPSFHVTGSTGTDPQYTSFRPTSSRQTVNRSDDRLREAEVLQPFQVLEDFILKSFQEQTIGQPGCITRILTVVEIHNHAKGTVLRSMTVDGDTTVFKDGQLTVEGDLTGKGNLNLEPRKVLIISGNLIADVNLNVTGSRDLAIDGTLTAGGDVSVNGSVTPSTSDAANFGGMLHCLRLSWYNPSR
jgi:hypothetical protein